MPRVLHVTPYMDASAGGPPVVVARLLAGAAAAGFEAGVLTTAALAADGGRGLARDWPDSTILPGQISALHGAGRQQVRAAVAGADILHMHTMWAPLVAAAAREARRLGIPYILSPHGMLDPYSMAQKRWKKRLYLGLVERRVLRGADRLLFTAEEERRLAERVTGPCPSAVIALGADQPPAPPETLRAEFLDAHPALKDRPLLIFLGRFHGKKRPEVAIGAMARLRDSLPDACLLMAGSGPAEDGLRAQVAALGLGDHVRFLGFLSGRQKWQALSAADLFLLPSRQENFGIALAEALHAGTPALITRKVNIWREVTEAGAGAVLDETDLEADLAETAITFLTRSAEGRNASAAARRLAQTEFDWSVSARDTYALYKTAIENGKA